MRKKRTSNVEGPNILAEMEQNRSQPQLHPHPHPLKRRSSKLHRH
ncbi:unnamed protein product [Callosobruchus maculatus]|uniref:Uncharacterized protein n=1 Tax=Callosobruchus maculatus TaxID=64391 RepID=A0A653CDL7_CALMS|nr:unnamed protein product [Callosobruchus maculatus]